MRRICGQPMPIEWGFMCDGNLPRKTVGGGSIVLSFKPWHFFFLVLKLNNLYSNVPTLTH
jgi:hypothetical protein